jgi:hypothetical protein
MHIRALLENPAGRGAYIDALALLEDEQAFRELDHPRFRWKSFRTTSFYIDRIPKTELSNIPV